MREKEIATPTERIVKAAREGERDPVRLRAQAIASGIPRAS
jgi:hypothetical protein